MNSLQLLGLRSVWRNATTSRDDETHLLFRIFNRETRHFNKKNFWNNVPSLYRKNCFPTNICSSIVEGTSKMTIVIHTKTQEVKRNVFGTLGDTGGSFTLGSALSLMTPALCLWSFFSCKLLRRWRTFLSASPYSHHLRNPWFQLFFPQLCLVPHSTAPNPPYLSLQLTLWSWNDWETTECPYYHGSFIKHALTSFEARYRTETDKTEFYLPSSFASL